MKHHRAAFAAVLALAMAACSQDPHPEASAADDRTPAGAWAEADGPGETALVFTPEAGEPLALICLPAARRLRVETADPSFVGVTATAPATLYLGAFSVEGDVARMALGDGRSLVQMTTDLTGEVLVGLTAAESVRLVAGEGFVETASLAPEQARAFAERCAAAPAAP